METLADPGRPGRARRPAGGRRAHRPDAAGRPRRVGMDCAWPTASKPPWDWFALAGAGRRRLCRLRRAGLAGLCKRDVIALGRGALARRAPRRRRSPSRSPSPSVRPDEYDLTKWAYVNYFPARPATSRSPAIRPRRTPGGSSPGIPTGSASQDSLHIGTHPPGLIVAQCILLRTMERNPALAGVLDRLHAAVGPGRVPAARGDATGVRSAGRSARPCTRRRS